MQKITKCKQLQNGNNYKMEKNSKELPKIKASAHKGAPWLSYQEWESNFQRPKINKTYIIAKQETKKKDKEFEWAFSYH